MKTVELRRHSLRTPPEEHLSPEGVALAGRVGRTLGRTDLVISSPAPRALETVRGLGRTPSVVDPLWQELGEAVSRELPWPTSFVAARDLLGTGETVARAKARELWDSVRSRLAAVPEEGGLLIVTHGGFCELLVAGSGLAASPLEADGPIRCLEGVRFELRAGVPTSHQLLRLPARFTRV